MLLPLTWLRDYLLKSDVHIEPDALGEKLTMRGLQVEAVKRPSKGLEKVVVGRIEAIEKHPNADRLQVTRVVTLDTPEAERLQIVCGAKNIAVGDIVPVAVVGAVLPGNIRIKQTAIRGVDSFGMLCSSKELGVADDTDGILQLPKHSQLGKLVSDLLGGGPEEIILELELTPNRGDCLSVMGLAREIAPILKTKLREQKPARFRVSPHRTSSIIKVEVDDDKACPRYVARVIDGLKVTESPDWIKHRLESVELRPINNIVDITNFVMFEMGQPLHAFDLRKIESGTIRVAPAKESAPFQILTGDTVQIEPGDILILDGDRPIALAGIMGGLNSQVEPDTTSIVLESAVFDAIQIRKTAKRLGLSTDASKRFERGVDIVNAALASDRATSLLRDIFNGNVYHPGIDTKEEYVSDATIALDMRDVRKTLGLKEISSEEVASLLEDIGITSQKRSTNILVVRLPTFRADITSSVDLVEEVARLKGFEAIRTTLPISVASYHRDDAPEAEAETRAKEILSGLGLRECVHYSFTSESLQRRSDAEGGAPVKILNPVTEQFAVLRTSLLPSLLETYQFNHNRHLADLRLFEVARVYHRSESSETKVQEHLRAAALLSGNSGASWRGKGDPIDFYVAKGIVEEFGDTYGHLKFEYRPIADSRILHPKRGAQIFLHGQAIGVVGEVHPWVQSKWLKTSEPIVLLELSVEALGAPRGSSRANAVKYLTPSKFPGVEYDLAFVVDQGVPSMALAQTIRESGGGLLTDVAVFDFYQGPHLTTGKKSLAFRLSFGSAERTLQEGEVQTLREQIIRSVESAHSAQLRG